MKKEIKIPEIAENVEKGVIVGILVAKGDKVKADQALVEIETDKATTDLSSPYAGVIEEIKVKEGDEVKVNQVIMIIETEDDEAGSGDAVVDVGSEEQEEDNDKEETKVQEEDNGKEETKDQDEGDKEEEKSPDHSTKEKSEPNADEEQPPEESEQNETESGGRDLSNIPASPSVRRLAREQGIDLTKVKGSGPGNRISAEDIKSYSEKPAASSAAKEAKLPDFAKWGPVSSEAMTNIRKITSKNVQQAWQIIPHVTQFDEADMTNLENFRKNNQDKVEREGGKLTVTAILLKIAGFALLKFPRFNASLDTQNEQIIYKHYVNVGIAADTPQGLLVPVVRDVNKKSLTELSVELTELAQKARDKKISLDEMQGGNFTISNLGGIGGTNFTPIVLSPQVAILGVSRAKYQQVFVDDEFQKRLILPLSLSYDHRVIDGADGVRFLRWICEVIEDPYALLQ